MRRVLPPIIFLTLATGLSATSQESDWIIYKNKKLPLFSNPLEVYFQQFEKQEERRIFNPPFGLRPNNLPTFYTEKGGGEKSSNWRGYVAKWLIEGDKLYLSGIDAWVFCGEKPKTFKDFIQASKKAENWRKAALKDVAPGKMQHGRIFADWYSGELRIPQGKLLLYVQQGYLTKYESETIINVNKGIITSISLIHNNLSPTEQEQADRDQREIAEMPPPPPPPKRRTYKRQ